LIVSDAPKGSQAKNWTAVLARGELKEVSTVPIKPVMERDLPLDTTPGQSRGVQGLFDGAVEIDMSDACVDGVLVPDDELGEPYA
jgi:hypothetical protein